MRIKVIPEAGFIGDLLKVFRLLLGSAPQPFRLSAGPWAAFLVLLYARDLAGQKTGPGKWLKVVRGGFSS
jgi:hypothetical protein